MKKRQLKSWKVVVGLAWGVVAVLAGATVPPGAAWAQVDASTEAGAVASGAPGATYRIDAGDKVSVRVFNEPELDVVDQHVAGEGTITMPLIGELQVRGLTADELEELVTARLADGYLKRPQVSVSIDRYRLYFIKGEVRRPGGYSFVEGLTVTKAVALAGGFTERASEGKISIARDTNPDAPLKRVKPHTPIYPGDVITVGQSFF